MKSVENLTTQEVNLLVAKLEGVKVEIYRARDGRKYVARKTEWDPEGYANVHDKSCNWIFYEPTKDWSIAGPIIDRERINLTTYADEGEETDYWGAMYDNFQFEQTGNYACEAAMRSFVSHRLGETIDMDNLAPIRRIAKVRAAGFKDEGTIDFFEDELEVEAETSVEAEQEVSKQYQDRYFADVRFLGWK